jgi:hypothetical protein
MLAAHTSSTEDDYSATSGATIYTAAISSNNNNDDKRAESSLRMLLKLCDIGGGAQNRRLIPGYMPGTALLIFVYNRDDGDSFHNLDSWWRDTVTGTGQSPSLLIVATSKSGLGCKISTFAGQKWADNHSATYVELVWDLERQREMLLASIASCIEGHIGELPCRVQRLDPLHIIGAPKYQ